jgi:hypothetical protein
MNSASRRHAYARGTASLLSALILALAPAPSAAAVVSAVVAHSSTSTLTSLDYSKPNQHRLWYNSYQHSWDGVLPKNDGGTLGCDHYIVKDVAGSQLFTSVELEDRDGGRPDTFWDNAGKRLYVLGSHSSNPKFWRLGYDAVTDTYSIAPGVNGVSVPGMAHQTVNDPATLYVSPNGVVWVAVMRDRGLYVQRSLDGGASWLPAPITLDASVLAGDTAWVHFTNQGTTSVAVFASENATGGATRRYYWRIAQNADPTVPSSWTNESARIPGTGAAAADNHVSAARDSQENEYFVVKTQGGNPTDPLIDLYRRAPGGAWSQFPVTLTQDTPEQSRPSIVIDEETDELSIYTNDTSGGRGNRKRAPLSSLQNLAQAPLTAVFGGGKAFSDLISPREEVSSATGVVVLAHDVTDKTVWYSAEEGSAPQGPCAVIPGTLTIKSNALQWKLTNAGAMPATISQINLTWPSALGNLKEIKRDGASIYRTPTPPPSARITSFLGDPSARTIGVGKTSTITFTFSTNAVTTRADYDLGILFGQACDGCEVQLTP